MVLIVQPKILNENCFMNAFYARLSDTQQFSRGFKASRTEKPTEISSMTYIIQISDVLHALKYLLNPSKTKFSQRYVIYGRRHRDASFLY